MSRALSDFSHEPVMVDEVVELFAPVPDGHVVDATVGGAGHAAAILDAHPGLSIIGLDRDPDAIDAASARLAPYGGARSAAPRAFRRVGRGGGGRQRRAR